MQNTERATLPLPAVGEYVKVCLPGEAPWAECLEHTDGGMWIGRVANRLLAPPHMHSFEQDDSVRFRSVSRHGCEFWAPDVNR